MYETGYYWVEYPKDRWKIAFYSSMFDRWILPGDLSSYTSSDFVNIDPNVINRTTI